MITKLDNNINRILKNFNFLDTWVLRFFLGVAFSIHGYQNFPLPSENLMKWFEFSPITASFVPISALFGGIVIIVSGFFSGAIGNLLTRISGLVIVVYMIFAFYIAHQDWFITSKLFVSEQIFLFAIGLFFFLRGSSTGDK
tara:strand:- start:20 stop:442 length:423 start_codon:yes stop_codon:yes gene_type:complete